MKRSPLIIKTVITNETKFVMIITLKLTTTKILRLITGMIASTRLIMITLWWHQKKKT